MTATKQKQPTHLFVYVGHSTQTKNKLQEEFMKYLKSLCGHLVEHKDRNDLIRDIRSAAQKLNEKHSLCRPLDIWFSDLHGGKGLMIYGFHYLTFHLLEAYHDNN